MCLAVFINTATIVGCMGIFYSSLFRPRPKERFTVLLIFGSWLDLMFVSALWGVISMISLLEVILLTSWAGMRLLGRGPLAKLAHGFCLVLTSYLWTRALAPGGTVMWFFVLLGMTTMYSCRFVMLMRVVSTLIGEGWGPWTKETLLPFVYFMGVWYSVFAFLDLAENKFSYINAWLPLAGNWTEVPLIRVGVVLFIGAVNALFFSRLYWGGHLEGPSF